MVFCGQCGLQLPPGYTRCPRCGSVTEPDLTMEDAHPDDPTLVTMPQAAPPTPQPDPLAPPTPPQQQKLVLRPDDSGPGFGTSAANDPTGKLPPQAAISPSDPPGRIPYPAYPLQTGRRYRSQRAAYPGYAPVPRQFRGIEPRPARPSPRRPGPLLVVLFLLLLVLTVTAVAVAKAGLLKGPPGINATPTPTAGTTAADQARNLIQQYYNDINKRDYQAAYNLWGADYQRTNSLSDFSAGYTHTTHDDVTINNLTTLSNGTVRANITIVATEETTSGRVMSTYRGTYIIGPENGTWKFLSGTFQKIG